MLTMTPARVQPSSHRVGSSWRADRNRQASCWTAGLIRLDGTGQVPADGCADSWVRSGLTAVVMVSDQNMPSQREFT